MLKKLKDIVRKSSIHVCIVNCGGCNGCDVELVALLSPRYDLEQYGIYVHNNPREADVLLVTGAVTEQWRQEGGRVLAPVSDFIPVDAAIPGCPPRPSEILEAVLTVAPGALAAKGRAQDARKD